MAILSDQVRQQLHDRFAERLQQPVQLTLFIRPGSGRLILPTGLGCPTCEDARRLAEELQAAAPDHLALQIVDITAGGPEAAGVEEVPTLTVAAAGEEARIRWQGLAAGYEFAAVVDAIERVSRREHGLRQESLSALDRLTDPLELMVFATPT